ncbi:MAG: hypothetical protein J6Q06_00685, partial [Clostridia bacterium]|nr:hypothetical protein [Clostridia bacterium]
MIIDIADGTFKRIFNDKKFFLPLRWDNKNFEKTIETLFDDYCIAIKQNALNNCLYNEVRGICGLIKGAIGMYLHGFPSDAFNILEGLMERLDEEHPLIDYQKSSYSIYDRPERPDPLDLYRITIVNENIPYERSRVFHVPYTSRSKIATSRYSIAGFPSLYLGTSLELCNEEINYNPHEQFALAAKFKLVREEFYSNIHIKVIDLAIKPQDFIGENPEIDNSYRIESTKENHDSTTDRGRTIKPDILSAQSVRNAYIRWYPLIAACSYIRVNKKDPFAAEYIIPQLLMQWIRHKMEKNKAEKEKNKAEKEYRKPTQ